MKQFVFFLGLLLAILLVYLCVSHHAPLIQADIGARVAGQFDANDLPGAVQVSGRDVTLTGVAETDELRTLSGKLARSVYGVRNVDNQIEVMVSPSPVVLDEPEPDVDVLFIDPAPALTPEPDYVVVEATPIAAPVVDACQEELEALLKKETIVFASSQDVIKASSHDLLDMIAAEAQNCKNSVIHIHGHTDSSGNAEKNTALSLKRAQSVGAYLKDKGVTQDIQFYGEGSRQPVADNATPEGRAQNRRIEFKVIKK